MFTEHVTQGLKNWHKRAKQTVSKNNSISCKHTTSLHSRKSENSTRGSVENLHNRDNEDISSHSVVVLSPPPATTTRSGEEEDRTEHTHEQEISSHYSTSEITTVEEENHKIITRGTYDGEVSFGSSWKNMGSSKGIGEISSISEEDNITDIYLS